MASNTLAYLKDVRSGIEWAQKELSFLSPEEAQEECEIIFSTLAGVSRPEIYFKTDFGPDLFQEFSRLIEERKKRFPLAYLLKRVSFWDDELEIEEGVLIPRSETEILIGAFHQLSGFSSKDSFSFLDWGSGSGNIAVTIAKLFPGSKGIGLDLSAEAVSLGRKNAERLGVSNRLEWLEADGFQIFGDREFDVIFSNPPYIKTEDCKRLQPEVLKEPRLALDGGEDGLHFYRMIFKNLRCLKPNGSLWVEMGWDQSEAVQSFFKGNFQHVNVFKDFNQIERIVGGLGFHG